jgi:hypothetical protein
MLREDIMENLWHREMDEKISAALPGKHVCGKQYGKLNDWLEDGKPYAWTMVDTCGTLHLYQDSAYGALALFDLLKGHIALLGIAQKTDMIYHLDLGIVVLGPSYTGSTAKIFRRERL